MFGILLGLLVIYGIIKITEYQRDKDYDKFREENPDVNLPSYYD